jgi:hypothetical protein
MVQLPEKQGPVCTSCAFSGMPCFLMLNVPPSISLLLIQRLAGDCRTDEQIMLELTRRWEELTSGKDPGLTFEQVFEPR